MKIQYFITSSLVAFCCFAFTAAAQSAEGQEKKVVVGTTNINALSDVTYVQALGVKQDGALILEIDYGRKLPANQKVVMGSDNKPKTFETMIEALNYLAMNGWEFVNAYEARSLEGPAYHFILQKKSDQSGAAISKN